MNFRTISIASTICVFILTVFTGYFIRYNRSPSILRLYWFPTHFRSCLSEIPSKVDACIYLAAVNIVKSSFLIDALKDVGTMSSRSCLLFSAICFSWSLRICLVSINWCVATSFNLAASMQLMIVPLTVPYSLELIIFLTKTKCLGGIFAKVITVACSICFDESVIWVLQKKSVLNGTHPMS